MVVSIFGKSLLNASASRLHLQSQRGKVVDKWSRPFGRGSGRDSLRSSVRRAHPRTKWFQAVDSRGRPGGTECARIYQGARNLRHPTERLRTLSPATQSRIGHCSVTGSLSSRTPENCYRTARRSRRIAPPTIRHQPPELAKK